MAAEVVGDEPELVGERAFVLLGPAEVVLRPAVDEQDRRPVRLAPLAHVQPQAAAAAHRVSLHPPGPHLVVLCNRCHRVPPWACRRQRSWPSEERRAHRAEGLILCPGLRIFRAAGAYARPRSRVRCAILAGMEARASEVFVGTGTRARGARARARRGAGGDAARPSSSPARRASARPGSPPSSARRARDAGFEVLVGRSIDLVGTELPYQPFVEALRPLGEPVAGRRRTPGSQLRVFEETLALLDDRAAVRARAARARGSALGRYVDARSRRLPRTQSRRAADPAARDLPRGRALVGRAHADGLRTESDARARRSFSSSVRSSTTS